MGLNPDFRRQRPTTSCLKDGTTFSVVIGHAQSAGAGLAQSVQWWAKDWITGESWWDSPVAAKSLYLLRSGHDGLLGHAASYLKCFG